MRLQDGDKGMEVKRQTSEGMHVLETVALKARNNAYSAQQLAHLSTINDIEQPSEVKASRSMRQI